MMMEPQDNIKRVCHGCIGDSILANEVKEQGASSLCSYCDETREAITLNTLAERVNETLEEHFYLTLNYPDPDSISETVLMSLGEWERNGDPVKYVIADMAGLTEEVTNDVVDLLSNSWYVYRLVKRGGEHPYGYEAFYEEREPEEWRFRENWEVFCTQIGSRARFFSRYAEEILDSIFGDVAHHKAYDDSPVIRVIGPEDTDRFVWRAREAPSKEELKTILKSPDREIGPPPSRLVGGGRMNARGISVFYGAMEVSTCVSEIRPTVGSFVVVGKFELLRPVRLLDLDALERIYVQDSYFAPDYAQQKARVAFLRRLVSEISRPVMPQDEEREYLPSQFVAEYLASRVSPRLDGIIFPSAQTNGDGRNLVLFNHACGVELFELPQDTSVDVDLSRAFSDDDDWQENEITIFEITQDNVSDTESPAETSDKLGNGVPICIGSANDDVPAPDPPISCGAPTLRLDLESIYVQHIKAVRYEHEDYVVDRVKFTEDSSTVEVWC